MVTTATRCGSSHYARQSRGDEAASSVIMPLRLIVTRMVYVRHKINVVESVANDEGNDAENLHFYKYDGHSVE